MLGSWKKFRHILAFFFRWGCVPCLQTLPHASTIILIFIPLLFPSATTSSFNTGRPMSDPMVEIASIISQHPPLVRCFPSHSVISLPLPSPADRRHCLRRRSWQGCAAEFTAFFDLHLFNTAHIEFQKD